MPRKKDSSDDYVIEQMTATIANITDTQNKTWDDLVEVAYQFCMKNYDHHRDEAESWGVSPSYLILCALLYVEHPLVMCEGRMMYSPIKAIAHIIWAELNETALAIPIRKVHSIHSEIR